MKIQINDNITIDLCEVGKITEIKESLLPSNKGNYGFIILDKENDFLEAITFESFQHVINHGDLESFIKDSNSNEDEILHMHMEMLKEVRERIINEVNYHNNNIIKINL